MKADNSHCVLDITGVRIAITGPSWAVEQLTAYFQPWLRSPSEGTVEVNCILERDNEPLRTAGLMGATASGRVERLRNENSLATYYAYVYGGHPTSTFAIDTSGSVVQVDRSRALLKVVASDDHSLVWDAKDILQRQVYQPLMLRHFALLHASAVEVNGVLLAFTGRKGAGKSTTQLHAGLGGAQLVTADRLFARCDTDGVVRGWGYPARCSIQRDAFDRFPALGSATGLEPDGMNKVLLSIDEAADRLGTSAAPGGGAVSVFICDRHGPSGHMLTDLGEQEALDLLSQNWFNDSDPLVPSWLGLIHPGVGTDGTAPRDVVSALVRVGRLHKLDTSVALRMPPRHVVRELVDVAGS